MREVKECPGAAPVVCGDVRDGGSRRRVLARPRSGERGSWAWLAEGEALVCGAGNTAVVASWTAWRSDGSSVSRERGSGGWGLLSSTETERGGGREG